MHRMCDGSASEAKMRPRNKSNLLQKKCWSRLPSSDEVDKNFTILSGIWVLLFLCGCELNVSFVILCFMWWRGLVLLSAARSCKYLFVAYTCQIISILGNAGERTGYAVKKGNKMLKLELVKIPPLVDGC
jgi:hypothetical protein